MMPRSFCPQEGEPVHGWAPGLVWKGVENFAPTRNFFWLSGCTLSVRLCPDCPGFCLFVLIVQHTNTNIHAPGGIQIRNPSTLAATDLCPRPRGYWDWQGFDPRTVQPAARCKIDCPRFTYKNPMRVQNVHNRTPYSIDS